MYKAASYGPVGTVGPLPLPFPMSFKIPSKLPTHPWATHHLNFNPRQWRIWGGWHYNACFFIWATSVHIPSLWIASGDEIGLLICFHSAFLMLLLVTISESWEVFSLFLNFNPKPNCWFLGFLLHLSIYRTSTQEQDFRALFLLLSSKLLKKTCLFQTSKYV